MLEMLRIPLLPETTPESILRLKMPQTTSSKETSAEHPAEAVHTQQCSTPEVSSRHEQLAEEPFKTILIGLSGSGVQQGGSRGWWPLTCLPTRKEIWQCCCCVLHAAADSVGACAQQASMASQPSGRCSISNSCCAASKHWSSSACSMRAKSVELCRHQFINCKNYCVWRRNIESAE